MRKAEAAFHNKMRVALDHCECDECEARRAAIKTAFAQGEIHGLGLATENATRQLQEEVDAFREREAACCPEDRGFDEVIADLRAEVERLKGNQRLAVIEWCDANKDANVRTLSDLNGKFEKENDELRAQLADMQEAKQIEEDEHDATRAEVERLKQEIAYLESGNDIDPMCIAALGNQELRAEVERLRGVREGVQRRFDTADQGRRDSRDDSWRIPWSEEVARVACAVAAALADAPPTKCHPGCETVHNIECPNGSPMKHNAQREAKPAEVCAWDGDCVNQTGGYCEVCKCPAKPAEACGCGYGPDALAAMGVETCPNGNTHRPTKPEAKEPDEDPDPNDDQEIIAQREMGNEKG